MRDIFFRHVCVCVCVVPFFFLIIESAGGEA